MLPSERRVANVAWTGSAPPFFDLPLFQSAVKLHFFGQIGFELSLLDRVPDSANQLSHGSLLRLIADFMTRDDEPIECFGVRPPQWFAPVLVTVS